NTVLAIWMAYTYLNPLSSVGPGSYVLWQNLFNSYQLWKKRRDEIKY
ncbi:transporter, partial [Bacteroides uniformis]